ncbi:MAG TPA: hypothetical protein VK168_09530 [Saprospiraceae bacterium]|nr:hypothetical protein [Saprospiraceae bacterium]
MFVRIICLLIIVVALPRDIFAQDTLPNSQPVFIPLLAYWSLNDTFTYKVEEYKLNYRNDETLKDSTGQTYMLSLVVADTTDTTYIIRVINELDSSSYLKDLRNISLIDPKMSELAIQLQSINLEYVIDNDGAFLEARNLDAVQKAMQSTIDHMMTAKVEGESKKILQQFLDKFSSPKATQIRFFDHLQTMHKFYGMEYALDSTWIFQEKAEHPLVAGETLVYENELLTTAPEDWNGLIRQQNTVILEEEGATSLMRGVMKGIAAQNTIDELLEKSPPRIEMYISYVINPEWGVIYAMFYNKDIFMGGKLVSKQTLIMEYEGEW